MKHCYPGERTNISAPGWARQHHSQRDPPFARGPSPPTRPGPARPFSKHRLSAAADMTHLLGPGLKFPILGPGLSLRSWSSLLFSVGMIFEFTQLGWKTIELSIQAEQASLCWPHQAVLCLFSSHLLLPHLFALHTFPFPQSLTNSGYIPALCQAQAEP